MVVYGLQRLKLPTINDGVAEISGDVEAIKRELSPHVDTEAFVVVLQLPKICGIATLGREAEGNNRQ